MTFKLLLKFVEIQTKVASMFPVILGILFAVYRYGVMNLKNVALMIFSLLCIDMATTGLNNLMDYRRAIKRNGYGYEVHNVLGGKQFSEQQAITSVVVLVIFAVSSGILLALNTDWLVLLIGMASFGVAIFYSWGPLPISRTPLGEAFSGFFMGFVIFFLGVYINIYDLGHIVLHWNKMQLHFVLDIKEISIIILASIPLIAGIANIMLANNICDLEDDMINKRYTLPSVIGRKNALRVFDALYISAYLSWAVLIAFRWIPFMGIIALLTAIPVYIMVQQFHKDQDKATTFVLAVKCFVLMSTSYVLTMAMGIAIKYFF